MSKVKSKPKTKNKQPAYKSESFTPRKLKYPSYKSFKLSKRIKHHSNKPISSAYKLSRKSFGLVKNNWKLFLTITLIYGVVSVILVRGFGGLHLSQIKTAINDGFSGSYGGFVTGIALFGYLLGTAGSSATPAGGTYQTLLMIIVSLATIWTLRQVIAGNKVRARDGFYVGMYPLIPFIIILLVIGLQLVPMAIGSWFYSTVTLGGVAVGPIEVGLAMALLVALITLSLYMVCSSIFALYIVTLPDMTPMKALRSARQLVLHRRWEVMRKIIVLPLMLLLVGALVMLPLILLATSIAEWVFFLLSMLALIIVHTYMYNLYRELL